MGICSVGAAIVTGSTGLALGLTKEMGRGVSVIVGERGLAEITNPVGVPVSSSGGEPHELSTRTPRKTARMLYGFGFMPEIQTPMKGLRRLMHSLTIVYYQLNLSFGVAISLRFICLVNFSSIFPFHFMCPGINFCSLSRCTNGGIIRVVAALFRR